jgi:5-methyltetrahydropteroyltriglutamate--homocysteine methyltransferase
MSKVNPPFRAEQVGSLLRPNTVMEARLKFKKGEINAETLRTVEDQAILEEIKRVESIGMKVVTDGEFRREYFHLDFLEKLDGVTVSGNIEASSDSREKVGFSPPSLSVTGKLRHARNIQVEDFKFLKSNVSQTPKVSIPSPTMIHFRGGRAAIDIESYPDMDEFFEDLAQCYRDEINALYEAGCRYIQLDDTNLAYLCDPKMREAAVGRGDDPNELPKTYAALINQVIDNRPEDLIVGVHLCRGNFQSTWFAQGGYDPVAEVLFNDMNVDAYFLEYDDERSGGFEPLKYVPHNKTVVLGIVSSKLPQLEPQSELIERIKEAAKYMPLENMCLSTQCGFSSTVHGNNITPDDQWAKLELVVNTAREVWGNN